MTNPQQRQVIRQAIIEKIREAKRMYRDPARQELKLVEGMEQLIESQPQVKLVRVYCPNCQHCANRRPSDRDMEITRQWFADHPEVVAKVYEIQTEMKELDGLIAAEHAKNEAQTEQSPSRR
jgi:predicted secreted protein